MSEWQLIETAPKDGSHILIYSMNGAIVVTKWNGVEWFDVCNCWRSEGKKFSHWMPLPKPPKEMNKENIDFSNLNLEPPLRISTEIPPPSAFVFEIENEEILRIDQSGISFNRDNFSDWTPCEFAEVFIKVLENSWDIKFIKR